MTLPQHAVNLGGVTLSECLTLFATAIGPFLGIFAQKKIEEWRASQGAKKAIFKALMASRAATLSAQHVQALNMIDLEFTGTSEPEQKVREVWRNYLDHLGSLPPEATARAAALPVWDDKAKDYLAELLTAMGRCLGYSVDRVQIRKGIYVPEGHSMEEIENRATRVMVLELLSGKRAISTRAVPWDEAQATAWRKIGELLGEVLDGSRPIKVAASNSDLDGRKPGAILGPGTTPTNG